MSKSSIELFFRDPKEEPQFPGDFSTLYLVRRELHDLERYVPEGKALWSRAMLIMSTIDLLGKFLNSPSVMKSISARFEEFTAQYVTDDRGEPEAHENTKVIWQLRNALLHSFGLYWDGNKSFSLTYVPGPSQLITPYSASSNSIHYNVDLWRLRRKFDSMIAKFEDDIRKQRLLFDQSVYEQYGHIPIG